MMKFILLCLLSVYTLFAFAATPFGQVLQINTHFRDIAATPSWLLIIRDETNQQVLPYLYDIKNSDNYWIAFTAGHSYRITASELKFGSYAKIKNFCRLQNGIISGKSMLIRLSGDLTPNRSTSFCHVTIYKDG